MSDDTGASRRPEVLETDSGRKPFLGIVTGIVFLALSVLAVVRVTAGNEDSVPSYSSSVTTTTISGVVSGSSPATAPRRDSTSAAIFFFALVGVMVLVTMGIVWRARLKQRATATP